ncbi:MAG: DM13 domain-containing protein [Actinomycetia bacterium]|nr:DM13 domain-containing protein [Actinomycetes bacterium]
MAGIALWLAFGIFGIQTLFVDDEVDEAAPVFTSESEPAAEVAMPAEVDFEAPMPVPAPEVVTVAEGRFVDRSHPTSGRAVVLNDGTEQRFLRFEDFETDNGPDLNVYLTRSGADADASEFGAAGDFVDLGDLKGNVGPQNYEIPADVDLEEFDTVVIWCVRFGVAFGAVDLMAT